MSRVERVNESAWSARCQMSAISHSTTGGVAILSLLRLSYRPFQHGGSDGAKQVVPGRFHLPVEPYLERLFKGPEKRRAKGIIIRGCCTIGYMFSSEFCETRSNRLELIERLDHDCERIKQLTRLFFETGFE